MLAAMRFPWLALLLVGCEDTTVAAEGKKVVASAGDHVIVGPVTIDVAAGDDDTLLLRMHEGARMDSRVVTGNRIVKFGAHQVRFTENGSRVTIMVRAYKPSSPLTSDDALLAADEAMSPRVSGPVDCTSATLSEDGAAFVVHCRDTSVTTSNQVVKVDVVTGAILSIS